MEKCFIAARCLADEIHNPNSPLYHKIRNSRSGNVILQSEFPKHIAPNLDIVHNCISQEFSHANERISHEMPPLLKHDPDAYRKVYNYYHHLNQERRLGNELQKILNGDLTHHSLYIGHPIIRGTDFFVEMNEPLQLDIHFKEHYF